MAPEQGAVPRNYSDVSMDQQPLKDGIERVPDFVLGHVAILDVGPTAALPSEIEHAARRGGIKIYHHCCALIAELKPLQRGQNESIGDAESHVISVGMQVAQYELMLYCATLFERRQAVSSVLALAGTGPYWRWAEIRKTHVPEYDWITLFPLPGQDEKIEVFKSRFGDSWLALGTHESDVEITKIIQTHLHPMVCDRHAGQPISVVL